MYVVSFIVIIFMEDSYNSRYLKYIPEHNSRIPYAPYSFRVRIRIRVKVRD